jgi:hypothetical protein
MQVNFAIHTRRTPSLKMPVSIVPLLVQLINEPVLVVGRAASDRTIGASSAVVRTDAHIAAFVEETVERRHARGAG